MLKRVLVAVLDTATLIIWTIRHSLREQPPPAPSPSRQCDICRMTKCVWPEECATQRNCRTSIEVAYQRSLHGQKARYP